MECPNTVEMGAKEWESLPFVYLFFTKIVFSGGKGVGAVVSAGPVSCGESNVVGSVDYIFG